LDERNERGWVSANHCVAAEKQMVVRCMIRIALPDSSGVGKTNVTLGHASKLTAEETVKVPRKENTTRRMTNKADPNPDVRRPFEYDSPDEILTLRQLPKPPRHSKSIRRLIRLLFV